MTYIPHITIQSASRIAQVEPMLAALRPLVPTWYVPAVQADAYTMAGAKVRAVNGVLPMKPKQLNAALDDGFAEGRIVVTMDDDFVSASQRADIDGKIVAERVPLAMVIRTLVGYLEDSDLSLCINGFMGNITWTKDTPVEWGMGIGQLMAHKPSNLRFDELLNDTEDLDFMIQHHLTFGGLVRARRFITDFHYYNPSKPDNDYEGGYAGYRDSGTISQTVKYLSEKYPILEFKDGDVNQSIMEKTNWRQFTKLRRR